MASRDHLFVVHWRAGQARRVARAWRVWGSHWLGAAWVTWAGRAIEHEVSARTERIAGELDASRAELSALASSSAREALVQNEHAVEAISVVHSIYSDLGSSPGKPHYASSRREWRPA